MVISRLCEQLGIDTDNIWKSNILYEAEDYHDSKAKHDLPPMLEGDVASIAKEASKEKEGGRFE